MWPALLITREASLWLAKLFLMFSVEHTGSDIRVV